MSSKRRRFQPPITTYFSPTSTSYSSNCSSNDNVSTSNPSLSHNHYSAATSSPMPVVPATVQSSLLSVGMRVRKSVAEGYRTVTAMRMDEKNLGMKSSYSNGKGTHNVAVEPQPAAPYSSLLTTTATTTTRGSVVTDDGDVFSLPSSSQGSTSSDLFSIDEHTQDHGRRKRRLDSDLEDENYDSHDTWDDSLRMENIQIMGDARDFGSSASPALGRTILRPNLGQQKRKFFFALDGQPRPMSKRQDVMELDGDFEEPSFLRRREEVDADYVDGEGCEVLMNDA